jgi:hypothetical protein
MCSPFPHRQTLLHHVAANGIEVERQLRSPANAVDVLRLLIERGADPLSAGGAPVDNLCFAAALGDLAAVRDYFGADGRLRDDLAPVEGIGAHGPKLAPERIVEYSLIWAAAHDRREVVEYLLTKNPDLRVTEPSFRATALGIARHFENHELVALLESP